MFRGSFKRWLTAAAALQSLHGQRWRAYKSLAGATRFQPQMSTSTPITIAKRSMGTCSRSATICVPLQAAAAFLPTCENVPDIGTTGRASPS